MELVQTWFRLVYTKRSHEPLVKGALFGEIDR